MCGIAGIFDLKGSADINQSLLSAMNQVQFHRGPDEGAVYIRPGVGLAHRRLSIIDLSSGQQPMSSQDGEVTVVYNGEIYNHLELARELKEKGYDFSTRCDTEVILHAWREWGTDCVKYFRGMFAFAIYDKRHSSVFLARDRFGIKPLFYSVLGNGQLVFGSELKVLKTHPELDRSLAFEAVEDYFALGYVPEPKTIYRNVHKMSPGHSMLFQHGKPVPQQHQYWDIPFAGFDGGSEADTQAQLVDKVREAVAIRMVAEVPLGAFLSGGVDSGSVVAMMATQQSDPVNTCAIGFDEARFDETSYARDVATRYKTNHFENTVRSDDFGLLDQLAGMYDEPYADSSALPTYRVCQLAKQRVTVALSGDGGDENFAGYRRYRWHMNEEKLRSTIPYGIRRPVFETLGKLYPKLDWAPQMFRAKTTFEALGRNSVEAYLHSVSLTSAAQRSAMFSDNFKRELQGYTVNTVFDQHAKAAPTDDPLGLIQYLDMKTYLVGDILTKVDRTSMANSLEVRVPLLDHKLCEWVSGIPSNLKLKGQEGKYILKKSMEPFLPHDILYRPKMGFGVPLGQWFRGPLKQRLNEAITQGGLAETGLFNQSVLEKMMTDHQSGRREYSAVLWSLLMFQSAIKDDSFGLG